MRKLLIMAGIGTLSILMGIPTLVQSQDEQKPPRQEEPKPEPKAEPRAEPRQQEEKPPKQEERPQRQDEMKPPKHEDKQREQAQQPERSQQAARPVNGKSGHIPDDKFRAHFGREHTVVIRQPVIVEGQPRFQFGGYWFVIADPWPADWAYSDDCYIDYDDGEYYLFDLLHPGVRVALFVAM